MNDEMLLGVGLLLFIILFVPIFKTVKCMPLFKKNPVITALVITLVCIVALYEVLVGPVAQKNTNDKKPDFLFILIPYAALAISILAILLFRFLHKILPTVHLRNFQIRAAIQKFWRNIFSVESQFLRKSPGSDNITKEKQLP